MAYKIKNGIVEDVIIGPSTDYAEAPISWDAIARVTGSDATTTGQALVDVTGLTAPVVAAATYEFEAVLQSVASADTNGYEVGVAVTQTPVSVLAVATGNTATTTAASVAIVAAATATAAFNTTSGGKGILVVKGVVQTHATLAGTLSIQHMKVTSGTSTVKVGSSLKVRRIA